MNSSFIPQKQSFGGFAGFGLAHKNNRKTSKGRLTQRIKVPKYIIKKGLSELAQKNAELILSMWKENIPEFHMDLFVLNPNKYAGRTKVVFHKPTIK